MDLILWRNAEAEEGAQDLERRLTAKGRRQADRVAAWLHQRLPARFALFASPAVRSRQTAAALDIPVKTEDELAPGAAAKRILEVVGWPASRSPAIVVGHQPDLGLVLAALLSEGRGHWTIKKGGVWWLTNRVRNDEAQVVVRAVAMPDLL